MPKPEKLLPFKDWTPPWGEDPDSIDPDKLAKYIWNLHSDKEKLQGRVDETNEQVATLTTERDEAKDALDAEAKKGTDEKLAAAITRAESAEAQVKDLQPKVLRYEVALDEGLTKAQAKRLLGNTEEEIKADAEELLESFGGKKDDEPGENEPDDDAPARRQPRLKNGQQRTDSSGELSDKEIQQLVANGFGSGGPTI